MLHVLYFLESVLLNKCYLYFLASTPVRIQIFAFKLECNLYAIMRKTILLNFFIGNCSVYNTAIWPDFNSLRAKKFLKLDRTKENLEKNIQFITFSIFISLEALLQYSVHTRPPFCKEGELGVEHPTKFSQKGGGLWQDLIFQRGWPFWGGGEGVPIFTKKKLTPQCTLCLKMHFEKNKSVFLLKEIQHTSKLLELI